LQNFLIAVRTVWQAAHAHCLLSRRSIIWEFWRGSGAPKLEGFRRTGHASQTLWFIQFLGPCLWFYGLWHLYLLYVLTINLFARWLFG